MYNVYIDDQKAFVYFRKIKLLSVAVAGRRTGIIVERIARTWAKRLDNDPNWDIFEKENNKVNRPKAQLREEHKHRSSEFFDEYPQATWNDAIDSLTGKFEGLDVKGSSFGSFILHECNLTVKIVTRHPEQIQQYGLSFKQQSDYEIIEPYLKQRYNQLLEHGKFQH